MHARYMLAVVEKVLHGRNRRDEGRERKVKMGDNIICKSV